MFNAEQTYQYDQAGRVKFPPGTSSRSGKPWRVSEEKFLIEFYDSLGNEECSLSLGRSGSAVSNKVRLLREQGRMPPYSDPSWTAAEDELVVKSYPKESSTKIAKRLGRSHNAVKWRIVELRKQERLPAVIDRAWSEEDDQLLIDNFYHYNSQGLAELLGRSKGAVNTRAYNLRKLGFLREPKKMGRQKRR